MMPKASRWFRLVQESGIFPKERRDLFIFLLGWAHLTSISATQILLFGLLCYVSFRMVKKDYALEIFPYTKYFILMIALIMISALALGGLKDPIKKVLFWWIYLFFVGMFFLSYHDRGLIKKFLFFVALAADGVALVGVYQYLFTDLGRSLGFFSHQLTYANVLAIVLCMIAAILFCRLYDNGIQFKFYCISLALVAVGLSTAISRGPMLSALITVLIILSLRHRKQGVAICMVLLLFWLISILAIPNFRERYTQLFNDSWRNPETSVGVRVALWKASLDIIRDYPLLGIGQHNFEKVAFKYTHKQYHVMAHAHNSYLQFALTNGLPAFLVLFLLLIKWMRDCIVYVVNKQPYSLVGLS
ncbi:MAG: O-antigen ligase family protein, partial [Desulfosarcinaceae bacterium]